MVISKNLVKEADVFMAIYEEGIKSDVLELSIWINSHANVDYFHFEKCWPNVSIDDVREHVSSKQHSDELGRYILNNQELTIDAIKILTWHHTNLQRRM